MFSKATQYGIRALALLHAWESVRPGWVSVEEIGKTLDIPSAFLAKVLRRLARAGLLEMQRGRGGGYRLAHPGEAICLWDVVETLEGPNFLQTCILGLPTCDDTHPCPLHPAWKVLRDALIDFLRKTTLETLRAQPVGQLPPGEKDLGS